MAQTHTTLVRSSPTHGKKNTRPRADRVLAAALEQRMGLGPDEVRDMARRVSALFNGKEMIEDEPLDKETRAFLYRLHAAGIVRTYTVERKNEQGRQWLYFHWVLDGAHLRRIARPPEGARGPAAHADLHHPAAPPATVIA